jgi:hypothetical protein
MKFYFIERRVVKHGIFIVEHQVELQLIIGNAHENDYHARISEKCR